MKILITGATGFVGKAVTEATIKSGYQVSALVRSESQQLPTDVYQIAVGDFAHIAEGGETTVDSSVSPNHNELSTSTNKQDPDLLSTGDKLLYVMNGIDVVVHTAARAHVMKEEETDPAAIYHLVNVSLTERLARAAAEAGVKRFVFISTVKVNGEVTFGKPFTENDQPRPQDDYSRSKLSAEQVLMSIAKETRMEVVIIRPPLVYGPGVKGNLANMMQWLGTGIPLPLGRINNLRSLLALDNLVGFILLCIKHPKASNEVFLISDGKDISTTQLIYEIAAINGEKARLVPVPISWMKVALKLFGKKNMGERLFNSLQLDISKAREVLGWQPPISMEEQIKKMIES